MELLRVAAATLNQVPMDWEGNTRRILSQIKQAQSEKVGVLCFPELAITGYNCEDMFFSLHVARQSVITLQEIARRCDNIIVFVGLPFYAKGSMYNCVAVIQNKKIIGIVAKKVLPREGVHYESRWFEAWSFGEVAQVIVDGEHIPFGDLRFEFGKVNIGLEICEEAWGARGAAHAHALAGTELIVNCSASHFALGKYKTRENLVRNASRAMQVNYLYTNLVGLENGRLVYDGGVLLGQSGEITCRGQRFEWGDGSLVVHDIDLDEVRVAKLRNRSLTQTYESTMQDMVVKGSPIVHPGPRSRISEKYVGNATKVRTREEEFYWAETLALYDYLRKTGAKAYVLSLSGGCDSGSVAVLIAHMIAETHKKLGPKRMSKVFQIIPDGPADDPKSWIKEMLVLVYQATENSSATTQQAAATLAAELGATFHSCSIQDIVGSYTGAVSQMIGRDLNWDEDDLALQNIQARTRSPLIWLLANLHHAVLVSTSNRSEAAVGYATMDGDTSGGLAPIAGIDKMFLRHWLKWAHEDCQYGLGSLSSLSKILEQQPTAELRPAERAQTDEEDLMPYEILNRIEKWLVRDRMAPLSIHAKLEAMYTDIDSNLLKSYLQKFLRLWCQSQWKRERLAPGFHVDDESLDPKTWCRFPVLSSGFVKEIKDLEDL